MTFIRNTLEISVISVLIGNILPLFQKQDTDYLDEISQKISVMEELIKEDNNSSEIFDEITELRNDLKNIEETMIEMMDKFPKVEKAQSSNGR